MAEGANDKTEPASEKRKADARRKGNVAVSRDVTTAALLLAAIGLMALFAGPGLHRLTDVTRLGLAMSFDPVVQASLTIEQIQGLVMQYGLTSLLLMLPFLAALALVGSGAILAQTGFLWKESLPFDIGRLNPIKGFGRLVTLRSVSELIKA